MSTRRLSQALGAILAVVTVGLSPGNAFASNLTIHGVAGAGGTTCALTDGRSSSTGMSVTCGNGSGTTLNAIYMGNSGTVGKGAASHAWIDAPPGILIDTISVNYCSNMNAGVGWGGGSFWGPSSQYGDEWPPATCTSTSTGMKQDYPEGVPRYGFQLICGFSSCSNGGYVYVPSFTISATESTGPSLIAVGTDNIWYHGGKWLWNRPSDPWNAALVGSDVTGVCKYQWSVGSAAVGQSYPQNNTTWQQCQNNTTWNASVDTAAYPNGKVTYQVEDWNAAGVASSDTQTLSLDNQRPKVSLIPAAGRPTGSGVTVDVRASAGPSGIASLSCTDDGAPLKITAGTVTVYHRGTHRIDCRVANNAVDPQGHHNTGRARLIVQITTSRVPVRRHPHGHVNVPVVIRWSWSGAQTVLRRITVGALPRRARVRITCAGDRCPWPEVSALRRAVDQLEQQVAGARFRSGDMLTLTVAVPGRINERAQLRIRDGRRPLVRRLS